MGLHLEHFWKSATATKHQESYTIVVDFVCKLLQQPRPLHGRGNVPGSATNACTIVHSLWRERLGVEQKGIGGSPLHSKPYGCGRGEIRKLWRGKVRACSKRVAAKDNYELLQGRLSWVA
nr:hypothetical protein Itr_chr08CG14440 [Ipomoea trifida]